MRITLLGTASGWTVPHRNASAIVVEVNDFLILLDAGEGVTQQLLRHDIDPNRLEHVFISHTHADHAIGLFGLLMWMYLAGRRKSLNIWIPQGMLPRFETVFPFFHIYQENWPFDFQLSPIDEAILIDTPILFSATENKHLSGISDLASDCGLGSDSCSFQFYETEQRKVIYTSDVDSLNHLQSYAVEAHSLIAECSHIELEEIRAFKRQFSIGQVILTHIPPDKENELREQSAFLKNEGIHIATDGFVFEV